MPRCDALSFFIISNGVSMTSKHQMEHIINRSLGGGMEYTTPTKGPVVQLLLVTARGEMKETIVSFSYKKSQAR